MIRKMHNNLLALSTSGLTLVLGLMLATPVTTDMVDDTRSNAPLARADVVPTRQSALLQARVPDPAGDLSQHAPSVEALSPNASAVTGLTTEEGQGATLRRSGSAMAVKDEVEATAPERSPRRSRARSALKTPYFSFAHGLRGNGA